MASLPDFDTLKWLAEHQPAKLKQLQDTLTDEIIDNASQPEQLKALKHHLEQQLDRCHNPYHRCVTAMALMRGKLFTLAAAINHPDDYLSQQAKVHPYQAQNEHKKAEKD